MPNYTFEDIDTGDRHSEFMKMTEFDTYRENNPHLKSVIVSPPAIGDAHRLGRIKPDAGFRDVLNKVNDAHPGSKMKGGAKNTVNTW